MSIEDPVFQELVAIVFNLEGGYVNDPHDAGGPTKFGIAWNYNVEELRALGFKNPTDIKNLTKPQALEIYYRKYWVASGADRLAHKSKRLAFIHFDTYVNGGGGLILRRLSVNPHNFEGHPANQALWLKLFAEYAARRADYFTRCKTWDRHGKGWTRNRIAAVMLRGLAMDS